MAERSIDERIRLWYEQFDSALEQTQREFAYSHPLYHDTLQEAQRRFSDATDITAMRADYLASNPAEVVQDRLDALRVRAEEALARAPVRDYTQEMSETERQAYEGDALDIEAYESRGSDPRAEEWEPYGGEPDDDAYRPLYGPDDRPYETQYTGMIGRTVGELEIDTSDTDMGERWQEQLAALDARLEALREQGVAQEEERGVEW